MVNLKQGKSKLCFAFQHKDLYTVKKNSWRDKKKRKKNQPLMLSCGTKGLVHEVSQVIAYLSFDVT